MGSMNWLGFSLSPQEQLSPSEATDQDHPHHHHHSHDQATVVSHRLAFNSDEISGTDVSGGDCFDLTSDVSTAHPASLNHLPSSFGILEAFNRNINHSQDWNMKGLGMNSDDSNYKSSTSELSMLMGSSCSSHNLEDHHHQNHQQQQPKLENFLGRHSFADPDHHHHNSTTAAYNNSTSSHDYMFSNCSLQLPSETSATTNNLNNNGGGSSIGLSMIKTWLRNQPAAAAAAAAPPHDQQPQMEINKNNDGGGSVNVNNAKTSAQSTLSLSMSTGSHATATTAATTTAPGDQTCSSDNKQSRSSTTTTTNGTDISQTGAIEAAAVPRKSIDTFGQRTSIYRGVTRHRWTGRYEAHLWDNSCRREGQTRKGRQVYLGGYDKEEKAARAYDLAALKYWGTTTTTNFPISNYETEIHDMKDMTRQEYVASLRRKSSGFSRGASIYRGVTRHHQHGRWQARIGRVAGNKDLYLGTFSTQEEAAEAYDIAAIKFRGLNAVTNFDMSRYDVKSILESSTLPIGAAKRLKDVEQQTTTHHPHHDQMMMSSTTSSVDHDINMMSSTAANSHNHQLMSSSDAAAAAAAGMYHAAGWPTLAFNQLAHHHHHQQPPFSMHYSSAAAAAAYGQHGGQSRVWCKQEQDTTNSNQSSIIHDHHSQDDPDLRHHQLQLGSTHNFFQPTAMHNLNLMGLMDHSGTSSMEYSAGSTTGGSGYGGGGGGGGYIIPMAMGGTVIATNDHHCISSSTQNQDSAGNGTSFGDGDDQNVYGSSTDNTYAAAARNLYYLHPQQSSSSVVKASAYDHNNWVPTAVPTHLGRSSSNTSMQAQGPPTTFTVWNDT